MRRLAPDLGIHVGAVFGRSGKPQLRASLSRCILALTELRGAA